MMVSKAPVGYSGPLWLVSYRDQHGICSEMYFACELAMIALATLFRIVGPDVTILAVTQAVTGIFVFDNLAE